MHVTHASGTEPRRWTRAEYDRMIEHGLLGEDDRVELIDGEILTMAPQGTRHAGTIRLVQNVLGSVFGHEHVGVQLPFALDPASEPEPDLAVVPGSPRDYLDAHPETALLVVEVADTTLAFARRSKGSLYARAGIAEYWIVNVSDGVLEVYRQPVEDPSARYGFAYRDTRVVHAGDRVVPLAAPDAEIPVAELLP
jgi:Uma2 family endonuclease